MLFMEDTYPLNNAHLTSNTTFSGMIIKRGTVN